MLTTAELIVLLRKKAVELGHNPTDYAVAKILGLTPNATSGWIKYGKTMSDDTGRKAAELLDLSVPFVIACLNAERNWHTVNREAWAHIVEATDPANQHAA